jgi:hypothetical protein
MTLLKKNKMISSEIPRASHGVNTCARPYPWKDEESYDFWENRMKIHEIPREYEGTMRITIRISLSRSGMKILPFLYRAHKF